MSEEQKGAVSLSGVSRSYGSVHAARDVSLDVRPGEFLTLLGPSGCGKTTLLRMIAGFETPDTGRVIISGRDLTDAPPYRRPVNTVFQHYALFPHRTVAGNVAFGLETAGAGRRRPVVSRRRSRWCGSAAWASAASTSSPADSASASRSRARW